MTDFSNLSWTVEEKIRVAKEVFRGRKLYPRLCRKCQLKVFQAITVKDGETESSLNESNFSSMGEALKNLCPRCKKLKELI